MRLRVQAPRAGAAQHQPWPERCPAGWCRIAWYAWSGLPGNWDTSHLPVIILVSDRVPTVDLEHFGFQDEHVQAVKLYDQSGNFRTPDDVRQRGRLYDQYGQHAGETLADTMLAIQNLKATMPNVIVYAVAVQAAEGGIFNDDILRYVAAQGGGDFFMAQDAASLARALQWAYIDSACGTHAPPPPVADCSLYTPAGRQKSAPRQITLQIQNGSGENRQVTHVHIENWPAGWGKEDWIKVFGQQFGLNVTTPPADKDVQKTLDAGQAGPVIFKFQKQ